MSAIKTFVIEYMEMGGKFRYESYEDIPRSIVDLIEDHCDGKYTKVPLNIINGFLNDFMDDLMEEKQVVNGVDIGARRTQLLGYLREGVVTVGFTKKNGEDRRMTCTLTGIPEDKQPKGEAPTRSGTSLAVFDVDKQDWRSFNLENVFELKVGDNYIFQTVGK